MQMDTMQIWLLESCFLTVNRMCADNGGRAGYDPQPNGKALPRDAPGMPTGSWRRSCTGANKCATASILDREAGIFDLNVPQYIIMLQCQNTLQLQ